MKAVNIKMLGEFSLSHNETVISDNTNRARKVWSLLAYILSNRTTNLPSNKLINAVWGDERDNTNPENALRITLHRLRGMLDTLWDGAGMELVLYKNGGYMWNPDVKANIDAVDFENLINAQYPDHKTKLTAYLQALDMYTGEFLPRFGGELWAIPIATHYRNLYLEAGMEAARLLMETGKYDEAAQICRQVAATEPYHEPLHQLLMTIFGAKGDRRAAGAVFESLSNRLMEDFGLHPTDKTQAVYRRTAFSPESRILPVDEIINQLQEPPVARGAMVCDYDYFKVLCFARKRSMEREDGEVHVALLNLTDKEGDRLSNRVLENIMSQMERRLRKNLRRGDIVSRCSTSQFIIMLPGANFENSNMVCRRVIATYHHAYPKAAIKVNYTVYPLTADSHVPYERD